MSTPSEHELFLVIFTGESPMSNAVNMCLGMTDWMDECMRMTKFIFPSASIHH